MLNMWEASSFHATDFYNGAGEFRRDTPKREQMFQQHSREIPWIIGKSAAYVLLVAFNPQEFDKLATPQWKKKFGESVHSHAVQLSLIATGWWRQAKYPSQSLAVVMEAGDEDGGTISQTVERMRADEATAKVIRVSSFTTAAKGVARGTEAADFAARHWNKYYLDKFLIGKKMDPRKDLKAFVDAMGTVDFIDATGDMLRYFFSLVPPEVLNDHTDHLRVGKSSRTSSY